MENDDRTDTTASGGGLEGTVLAGRYRVAQVLSTGANTVIMDAIDLSNDGQVTVKVVRPEHARDEEFRRKFRRLAEISQALTHPNIASVQDWGPIELKGESTVFWTVDALGGGSLRDLLDRGRLLEPGQALVVGLEACRALDAAHQKGLFHTELTPSKMVFGADRRLRVVDFGMARLLAEPAWAESAAVPTHVARYASPEQALGLPIDSKTDVYALALVMLEAVTGEVPFAADSTVATLAGRVDKLMPVSADLGPLASVLERAGRPEAADRFTAAEFGRALVQAAPKLPKPDPIPVLATGQFDTTAMRRPTDPTGGVERPAPVAGLALVNESGVSPLADPARTDADADPARTDADADADRDDSDPNDDAGQLAAPVVPIEPDTEGAADPLLAGPKPEPEPDLEPEPKPEPEPAPAADSDPDGPDAPDDAQDEAEAVADDVDAADDDATVERASATAPLAVAAAAAPIAETTASPVLDAVPDSTDAAGAATLYDDAPRTRRRGPVIILVLLLLGGLGALAYAGSLLLQTKSFEVPVLAGSPEEEAMNQIVGNDWDVTTVGERSDTFPEPDTVIRTLPGPGVELEEGASFTLVLSQGPEFRTLPDLDGLPVDSAIAQLADLRLIGVEAAERQFSETVVDGSIISWQVSGDANGDMQAGADILPGETVVLTVSMGPEPRSVPDVTGLSVADATAVTDNLVLLVAQADDVFSDDVAAGLIVSQTPAPGIEIPREGTVTVQVSKGPDLVTFPELDGLSFVDAQALLLETGFVIGDLLGSTDGVFVEATIDGEDVEPGTEFRRGQPIDLIFL